MGLAGAPVATLGGVQPTAQAGSVTVQSALLRLAATRPAALADPGRPGRAGDPGPVVQSRGAQPRPLLRYPGLLLRWPAPAAAAPAGPSRRLAPPCRVGARTVAAQPPPARLVPPALQRCHVPPCRECRPAGLHHAGQRPPAGEGRRPAAACHCERGRGLLSGRRHHPRRPHPCRRRGRVPGQSRRPQSRGLRRRRAAHADAQAGRRGRARPYRA